MVLISKQISNQSFRPFFNGVSFSCCIDHQHRVMYLSNSAKIHLEHASPPKQLGYAYVLFCSSFRALPKRAHTHTHANTALYQWWMRPKGHFSDINQFTLKWKCPSAGLEDSITALTPCTYRVVLLPGLAWLGFVWPGGKIRKLFFQPSSSASASRTESSFGNPLSFPPGCSKQR